MVLYPAHSAAAVSSAWMLLCASCAASPGLAFFHLGTTVRRSSWISMVRPVCSSSWATPAALYPDGVCYAPLTTV